MRSTLQTIFVAKLTAFSHFVYKKHTHV